MSASIELDGVWKSFPRWSPGTRTAKELILRRLPTLMRFSDEKRWALRDVSFTVDPGESLGIIGHNGAGKSTLLRLAAGLGRTSRGRLTLNGDVRALLSLGDTFDVTLSGRENAVTAGLIAGLSESEVRRRLPAVLEFAELESFAEAPVRTYSEGMKLRLAMGVAVQLPAPIMLMDEVLAVGDLAFQQRCLEHVRTQRERGTCLVFASHDLDRVVSECDRVLWLSGGTMRMLGSAESVVDAYRRAMISATMSRTPAQPAGPPSGLELGRTRFGSQEATIDHVQVGPPEGKLRAGGDLSISLRLVPRDSQVTSCVVAVSILRRRDGVKALDANTAGDGVRIALEATGTDVALSFPRVPLAPGTYDVEVGAYRTDWEYAYDLHVGAHSLEVLGQSANDGVVDVPHSWSVAA